MNSNKTKNIFRWRVGILVFLLAVILGGLFFHSVSAAVIPGGLVPCGNGNDPNQRCTLCYLVVGFQGLINWGLKIFVFLALLMLVVAGVIYIISTGDQGLMGTAKGILMNTLFGFAFVLLAWLLVNYTIYLLGAKVGLSQNPGALWYEFTCDQTRAPLNGGGNGTPSCSSNIPANSSPCNSVAPSVSNTVINLIQTCPNHQSQIACTYGCNVNYNLVGGACVK